MLYHEDKVVLKYLNGSSSCFARHASRALRIVRRVVEKEETLEYAGRGLRPVVVYSLDAFQYSGEKRRSDRIAQDAETGKIVIYR